MLSGCGGGGTEVAGPPKPRPSATYDKGTVQACQLADQAAELDDVDAASKAGRDALRAAEVSDQAALRGLAATYTGDGTPLGNIRQDTGALKIRVWCLNHGLSK